MSLQGVTDFIVAGPAGHVQAGPAGHFQAAPAGSVVTGPAGHVPIDTRAAIVPIDTSQARIPYSPATNGDNTAVQASPAGGGATSGGGAISSTGGGGGGGGGTGGGASVGGSAGTAMGMPTTGGGGGGTQTGGGQSASSPITGSAPPTPATGGGKMETFSAGPGQPMLSTDGSKTSVVPAASTAPPMGNGPGRIVTEAGPGSAGRLSAPPVGLSPIVGAGGAITVPPLGFGAAPDISGYTPVSPSGYVRPHKMTDWHGPGIGHTLNWPAKNTQRIVEEKGWEPEETDFLWIPVGSGYASANMLDTVKGGQPPTKEEAKGGAYYDFSNTNSYINNSTSDITMDNGVTENITREFNPDYSTRRNINTENVEELNQNIDSSSDTTMDLSETNVENNKTENKQITQNEHTSNLSYETQAHYDSETNFVNDVDQHRTSNVENREIKNVDASTTEFAHDTNITNRPDNSTTYNIQESSRTYNEDSSRQVVNNVEDLDTHTTEYTFVDQDLSSTRSVHTTETNFNSETHPNFDFSMSMDITHVNRQAPELGGNVMALSA
ncbi:hypothetical protein [Salidesulfovibrio brasiliensis]